jgi:hypothetical protein
MLTAALFFSFSDPRNVTRLVANSGEYAPRAVIATNGHFVNRSGFVESLRGANIVVKGPPWLPGVGGEKRCNATKVCTTFNEADALYFRSQGWNLVRLGVTWAGGQPDGPDAGLDPAFVARLHALLELCDRHGLRVLLDLHQDAMGSALCGEGVPMWYSQRYTPWLLGLPVFGYIELLSLVGQCSLSFSSEPNPAASPLHTLLTDEPSRPCAAAPTSARGESTSASRSTTSSTHAASRSTSQGTWAWAAGARTSSRPLASS